MMTFGALVTWCHIISILSQLQVYIRTTFFPVIHDIVPLNPISYKEMKRGFRHMYTSCVVVSSEATSFGALSSLI